jgi:hypothetical protein
VKKQKPHIAKLLSVFMLIVFAFALTPWHLVHQHNKAVSTPKETNCHHISHVEIHTENCLICAFGFEKNYIQTHQLYTVFLSAKILNRVEPVITSSFVQIKRATLRGPPIS